jgi:hypothetical protein
MKITASEYINNSRNKKSFVGVFHYTRPIRSKHDGPAELYGLFTLSSEVEIPGQKVAKFAWDGVVDGFEYSNKDSVNEAIKVALTECTRRVKQLIANDKNISNYGVDLNLVLFVSNGGGVYLGNIGDNDIYLYKDQRIVDISEMLVSKKAQTASLVIGDKDLLFASSKTFLKRNLRDLMAIKSDSAIPNVLERTAGKLGLNEALLVIKKEKVLEKKIKIEKVEKVVKVLKKESENTDYVPIKKVKEEDLSKKEEKDLNKVIANISSQSGKMKEKTKGLGLWFKAGFIKITTKIKVLLINLLSNLGSRIGGMFSNKRWFKKVSAKVSQSTAGTRSKVGMKAFKVDGYKDKNKKIQRFKLFFTVLLILVVIFSGVKFTIDQREASRVSKEANEIFLLVEDYVKQAEEKTQIDREGSEMLVYKAKEELSKVSEKLREKDTEKRNLLVSRIDTVYDILYKKIRVNDSLDSYLDTRLAFGENSKPTDMIITQDNRGNEYIIVADAGLKGVYRVSLYNKEVKKLPDSDNILEEPAMIARGRSGIFVLDLKVGVVRAEFDGDGWFKSFTKLTGLGIENIGALDIAEFAVLTDADNVYILDREKKTLLKSSNYGSGYGLSHSYINNDAFENANDILADLSVYILTSGPDGLHRYNYSFAQQTQVPAPVTVVGVDGEFKNLSVGYTRSDLNYDLYVFDSLDERVLRFSKPIEGGGEIRHPNQVVLRHQYLYTGERSKVWEDVKEIVVDRDQRNMYILDSSTIWKVTL